MDYFVILLSFIEHYSIPFGPFADERLDDRQPEPIAAARNS